jgi:PAS domain S-box-containing protein
LIVEDSDDDTILIVNELKRNGFVVMFERVSNHKAMENALVEQGWDVVIADYSMPQFDGINALKLFKEKHFSIPFLLVSGTVGEELAVDAMKAGADDYVMKDNLKRLVFAVKRELKEYEEHRELKLMNDAIQTLVESIVDKTGKDAFQRIVSSISEWLGAEYVYLGQIIDDDKIKVLSMHVDGELMCGCIKNIKGTLYESVMRDSFFNYHGEAIKLFPEGCEHCSKIEVKGFFGTSIRDENGKNIGILWAASNNNKLILPPRAKEAIEIIAKKVGLEIERSGVEEQLHKLSCAIEQSASIVVITDTKGSIEYVNPSFTKHTGYTFEEVHGQTPSILKSGKTSDGEYKQLWETVLSGHEWRGEFCNKNKDGELYWESESISPVKNKEGEITNFIAVKEDITERKRMEELISQYNEELELLVEKRTNRIKELELKRMENEKLAATGQLAAGFAHEVNNPLSCIKGGFMLIKNSITEEHKYYKYVGIIEEEIDRIARTVKQMFDLSRPSQGEISEFDSIVPIHETISMLKGLINEYGVNINLNCCENPVKVTMSKDYFKQVLINIIKNAIEASPEGGNVDVKVKGQNDRLNIIISDQGDGISDELKSKIFEPFFSTKDKYSDSGLGLGLSITKSIVESMGGALDFSSEEGKGTNFIIDLPTNIIKSNNVVL